MVRIMKLAGAAVAAISFFAALQVEAAQNCDTNPRKLDTKTSISTGNPAFAPFDNKCKGDTNITGPCTKDEDCASACCDGKKCRAPDALKGDETCRDGLAPDFTNGLKFVKKTVGGGNQAAAGQQQQKDNKGRKRGVECKAQKKKKKNGGKKDNQGTAAPAASNLACDTNPRKKDTKTSISTGNPAFAPFDNKCKGETNIPGACTKDEDCASACCDGKKCRAPDALKGDETCRDGLAPDFTNGLKFVKKAVGGAGNNGNQGNQNNNNQNNNNNNNQNCDTNPRKKDTKTSISTGNPAFAPFDNKCKGETNITGACTKDEDCASACCDGKKCRAPDALKGAETCRDGLAPDFTNGLKFVKKAVGGAGNNGNQGNQNNNNNNNQNNNNNNNQNCDTNPRKKDTKTSISTGNPAFAPFDNKCKGETNITGACTKDEDCASACCDGKKCCAPDALKGAETCRDGLAPDFTNGLKFVKKAVGSPKLRG